jgi:cation transport ATPase
MTEKEDKRIVFVRLVLWFGIIADFLNALQYIFPDSMILKPFGIHDLITPFTRFTLTQAAALMAAWTLLLIWADRSPINRRGVLLLTVPIAIGIGYSLYYLVASGVVSKTSIIFLAGPMVTASLFFAAYLTACKIGRVDRSLPSPQSSRPEN